MKSASRRWLAALALTITLIAVWWLWRERIANQEDPGSAAGGDGTVQRVDFRYDVDEAGKAWRDAGVTADDAITGTLQYDVSTNGRPDGDGGMQYRQSIPGGFRVVVGELSFTSSSYDVTVYNDAVGNDRLLAIARDMPSSGSITLSDTAPSFGLSGYTVNMPFADSSLPQSLDVNEFNEGITYILPVDKQTGDSVKSHLTLVMIQPVGDWGSWQSGD
jgi:hypothetical protein